MLIFLRSPGGIDSSLRLESMEHSRYFIVLHCFRVKSSYYIFSFCGLLILQKKMFLFYHPKINWWFIVYSLLKTFLFFPYTYLDKRYRYRQHRVLTQYRLMSVEWPKIDFCGTPQFISPATEKTCSSVIKNFLFERYDWNH